MEIRNILIGMFATCSLMASAQERKNVIDEVIWVVGDEAILKSDVENARMEFLQQGQRFEGDPYCVIPEQLAVQKLFLHQAAIDSVTVSDADVFQEVDMRLNAVLLDFGSREKLEEYSGKSLTQIREQMFNSYKDKKMVERVQRSLVENVKVTPAQVRRYFKDMPEDSIPFIPTKVECQIITREPVIPIEEIEHVKDDLRSYTERINNGSAQFSTLALLYSEDKLSAQQGGELGFAGRGSYVPEFANVAFNLTDPKAVSKIVETEFGFHIIQLIEKRGDMINCRHILRKPRVSTEALQKCVNDLDSIAAEINKGLYTFDECVSVVSYDKDTRNNYGLLFDEETGLSKYEMKDLPTEVARTVAGMKVGEISKPFIMVNKKGKEVVAIVKLKNRVNGHRATMAEDYQELQNVVMNKLCDEKLEQWIRDKQKTTYIHINEDWQNCEFQYSGWIK
ncbi:MAG: peptidylprolyl isomerase [Bacteroidaceae bacterium]|jgi:peptidyl-prolyl cis-trans isomerase SurA|nr:peptidylprolyl isomerase [Bacteroidaceae bacterium]